MPLCAEARGGTLSKATSGPMSSWAAETTVAEGTVWASVPSLWGHREPTPAARRPALPDGRSASDTQERGRSQPRVATSRSTYCAPGTAVAALASVTNGRGGSALGKVTCPSFSAPASLTNARSWWTRKIR